ncbi:RNA polymerase sigma factor [Flagellimonas pacifica]|uniref:Sigma-70 family RNA polymerase sigma factor n=1 Tax=Flagellimonas pacifica TaxID=1247520 RepID=A0A285MZF9_9FLAO|nr:sigma-70 family RNA polymerase sigma factor [Allomuricauda parva]SNZ01186.1 hypothetical protein SAMN06265377_3022 [Allomuricauda parva]
MKKAELEEILLKFSYQEDDEQEAHKAFTIYYHEYSRYLHTVIFEAKKSATYFYDDLVDIVAENTFLKIYNKPLDFIIEDHETDLDVDKKMKGYLATIAKNELKGLLNKGYCAQEHDLTIDDDSVFFDPPEIILPEENEIGHYQKVLQEVLLTFSERDRLILLSVYDCHQEGKKRPKEIMAWLAEVHSTSDMNIRKIKSRCDKKIREHFEKKTTLKPLKR